MSLPIGKIIFFGKRKVEKMTQEQMAAYFGRKQETISDWIDAWHIDELKETDDEYKRLKMEYTARSLKTTP